MYLEDCEFQTVYENCYSPPLMEDDYTGNAKNYWTKKYCQAYK